MIARLCTSITDQVTGIVAIAARTCKSWKMALPDRTYARTLPPALKGTVLLMLTSRGLALWPSRCRRDLDNCAEAGFCASAILCPLNFSVWSPVDSVDGRSHSCRTPVGSLEGRSSVRGRRREFRQSDRASYCTVRQGMLCLVVFWHPIGPRAVWKEDASPCNLPRKNMLMEGRWSACLACDESYCEQTCSCVRELF